MPTFKWVRGSWSRPLTVALDESRARVEWSFEKPTRRVLRRSATLRNPLPSQVSRSGWTGRGSTYRAGVPLSRVLDDLLALARPDAESSDVVEFVEKWGVFDEVAGEGSHPVARYFECAREVHEALAAIERAARSSSARKAAEHAASWLLVTSTFGGAPDLHPRWSFDRGSELFLTASSLRGGIFMAVAERLDGAARTFACGNCGERHQRVRRPPRGGTPYCPKCREKRIPQQLANAEYRLRQQLGRSEKHRRRDG